MKRRDRCVNRRARPAAHRALALRRPRNFQVGRSAQWLPSCRHSVIHVGGVGGEHPVCGGHHPCLVSNWGFSRSPSTVVRLDFADSECRESWLLGSSDTSPSVSGWLEGEFEKSDFTTPQLSEAHD